MKIIHYFKVALHFRIWTHEFWLALCHDLVEDGYIGKWILKYWISLDYITRRKDERYMDYIKRCSLNKHSKNVKIADLEENMKRCNKVSTTLIVRYNMAYKYLTQ